MGFLKRIHNADLREIFSTENGRQIAFFPIAADDDWFKTATALTVGENKVTTVSSFTKDYCPGLPVVPVIVTTESSGSNITAVESVVLMVDQFGQTISETVTHVDSSGTWTGTCRNAAASLVSVTTTVTGTADSSDSMIIGFAKTYGVGTRLGAAADVVSKLFNGSAEAGTVSVPYSTYTVAGTPDAAKELVLWVHGSAYK